MRPRLLVSTTTALAIAVGTFVLIAPPSNGASANAVIRWSMVPQSKDADGDGILDGDGGVPRRGALTIEPSTAIVGAGNHIAQPNERLIGGSLSWYLSPRGFPVRLDACDSTGEQYRWTVHRGGELVETTPWRNLARTSCRTTVFLPEADYQLELDVREGADRASATQQVRVRNLIVVAMGDSYASGEGNPRNVQAWVDRGMASGFDPYWDDKACHRSARGAPAQAALALENLSSHTSVTLVDVTCSGATVNQGILGAQVPAATTSQIEQAESIVGTRAVDLVTLSIGGNDVGFGSVIQTCALHTDCPVAKAANPPLSSYRTVQDGVQAETGALAAKYQQIAACLGGAACTLTDGRRVASIALAASARVLPTLYPDITRAADGSPCTYFTMAAKDFAWARDTILTPTPANPYSYPLSRGTSVGLSTDRGSLNQQVSATASLSGWAPVIGTWAASGSSTVGHGVCAGSEAWAFGATILSALPGASFHPNIAGQAVLARQIAAGMVAATR